MATKTQNGRPEVLGPEPTNAGAVAVETVLPYTIHFAIEGIAALLFHRWQNESVEAKSKAAKNSAAKKTDDIESYVYRNEKGEVCLPGAYVYGSMTDKKAGAARYFPDPRSPRASAVKLLQAAISPLTELATLGKGEKAEGWDYLDKRRVTVQQQGITRQRPAFNAGWRAEFDFIVNLPEYVAPPFFHEVLALAGRAVGVGDFRPTYGRFQVVEFRAAF